LFYFDTFDEIVFLNSEALPN